MSESSAVQIQQAVVCLQRGGIIAYPTEAVYGLGCDPINQQAVKRLLEVKKRSVDKGLILIAADWPDVRPFIRPSTLKNLSQTPAADVVPITWVYPASEKVPRWICGQHDSVAVRVTQHPIAKALCKAWHGCLVSTSANIEDLVPARTLEEAQAIFGNKIDYYLQGAVGGFEAPSQIRDALTGKALRP